MPKTALRLLAVLVVGICASSGGVFAYSTFKATVPNGQQTIAGSIAVGHVSPSGGGARNKFGQDFGANGKKWGDVCCLDSDGDGQRKGLELGDPCCTWTEGGTPDVTSGMSHPGLASSKTTNTIPETCPDACKGKSGGVDSGATKYAPLLIVGCALVAINFLN